MWRWIKRLARSRNATGTTLLVMRLNEMILVHPRMDQTHVCSVCAEPVGIYPSGQDIMRTRASVKLICNKCHSPKDGALMLAPGAENEPSQSVRVR